MVVFGQMLDLRIFEVVSKLVVPMVLWSHENATHSQAKAVCWFGEECQTHLNNPDWPSPESCWLLGCPLPSLQTHNRHPQHHGTEPLRALGHHTRDLGLFLQTRPHQAVQATGKKRGMVLSPGPDPATPEALSLLHWNPVPYFYGAGKSPWSCLQLWVPVARMMQGAEYTLNNTAGSSLHTGNSKRLTK